MTTLDFFSILCLGDEAISKSKLVLLNPPKGAYIKDFVAIPTFLKDHTVSSQVLFKSTVWGSNITHIWAGEIVSCNKYTLQSMFKSILFMRFHLLPSLLLVGRGRTNECSITYFDDQALKLTHENGKCFK